MTSYRETSITHDGLAFSGHYSVVGDTISLASAYGSKSAPLGQVTPDVAARRLLQEIVEAWCVPSR